MKSKVLSFVVVALLLSLLLSSTLAITVSADGDSTASEAENANKKEERIESLIFDISAVVFSITGLTFSLISLYRSRSDTVRVYYEEIEKPDYYKARHILYIYRKIKIKYNLCHYKGESFSDFWKRLREEDPKRALKLWKDIEKYNLVSENSKDSVSDDIVFENVKKASSIIANFYQKWGFLWHKNYLPTWVFRSSAGYNLLKLYLAIEEYVEEQRKENPYYALEFQNLCQRVYRRYRKVIKECSDMEKKNLGFPAGERDALQWNYKKKGGMMQSKRPVADESKIPEWPTKNDDERLVGSKSAK